jgi:hypothetical protein
MTLKSAGGLPPKGQDMNQILFEQSSFNRYFAAGGGYVYDATFSTSVGGYPLAARIPNSTGTGYWLNTAEDNQTNPENSTAALTGWIPYGSYGNTSITGLTSSSVTLTTLQASKDKIILSGALTANINIVLPAWVKRWEVINNCTGAFSVTVKTPSGTGAALSSGQKATLSGDGTNITADINTVRFAQLAGSGVFIVPAGVTTLYFSGSAGGAGGGGGSSAVTTSSTATCGGGGGAGQSVIRQQLNVSPGQSISYMVGNGGSGGAGSNTGSNAPSGTAGGNTTFGTLVTLIGGSPGGGGFYGTSTVNGGDAGSGYPSGGASVSSVVTGSNFVTYSIGGSGGSSIFGPGGAAGRGAGSATPGVNAFGFGGGGGGGGCYITTTNVSGTGQKGGNGSAGTIILEW